MSFIKKNYNRLIAFIGALVAYCGVSTSDFYTIELHQPEPAYVWTVIAVGLALLVVGGVIEIIRRAYVQRNT